MTELARSFALLFLSWSVGLTLTYGITESTLFMPFRIFLASRDRESGLLETLLYCPFCAGFWCQTSAAYVVLSYGLVEALGMGCVGTAVLLVARGFGGELVRSAGDFERHAVGEMRAGRRPRGGP